MRSDAVDPQQMAASLQKRARAMRQAVRTGESLNLQQAKATAKLLSEGPLSSAKLAAMGHPYAVRDPRPPGDPGVINRQSGLFEESWQVVAPSETGGSGGVVRSRLKNTAPYAGFLDKGTQLMIKRPIRTLVFQSVRHARYDRLRRLIKGAWKVR